MDVWEPDYYKTRTIKGQKNFIEINSAIQCFMHFKQGIYIFEKQGNRHKENSQALTLFMQALQTNADFVLECLTTMITDLNCQSQGLPLTSRLTYQRDSVEDLPSLRVLIHATTCFYNIAYQSNTLNPEAFKKLDQILLDLLALHKNLKDQDSWLQLMSPFKTDEAVREFVLFHIKDPQLKASIQAMKGSIDNKTDAKAVSQTDSNDLPKTLFFTPSTSATSIVLAASTSGSSPIVEEKPTQPSPFP